MFTTFIYRKLASWVTISLLPQADLGDSLYDRQHSRCSFFLFSRFFSHFVFFWFVCLSLTFLSWHVPACLRKIFCCFFTLIRLIYIALKTCFFYNAIISFWWCSKNIKCVKCCKSTLSALFVDTSTKWWSSSYFKNSANMEK